MAEILLTRREVPFKMPSETTPAGATPVAEGATPSQSAPATPGSTTAAAADPAKGDEDALGEPGKRALQVEREAVKAAKAERDAAMKELADLKLATASESEKAIAQAKTEGKTEVIARLHATVRRAAVREALVTAGAIPSLVADLSKADEFAALKVNDDDEIDSEELAKAVKAHKTRVKDAYAAPGDSGSADGGAQGGRVPATTLASALERHYAPHQG